MAAQKDTVLVVDDDRLIVAMHSDLLAPHFIVKTAPDGETAIKMLAEETFAAVLSDQNMPGLSGVEVLSNALKRAPSTVRVLITATDSVSDVSDAINVARAHRVIVKPVREVEFVNLVQGAIREVRLADENIRLTEELKERVAELQRREEELEKELNLRTEELLDVVRQMRPTD